MSATISTDKSTAEPVTTKLTMSGVNETLLANSRILFQMLARSYSGAARMTPRRMQEQHELEAWRQLCIK